MKLQPKKWADFQHYKDRSPPWIKLQKSLLDDFDFHCLPVASRALAPMLWLLASEAIDGIFDADTDRLAFRLRMSKAELSEAIKHLIEKGFFAVVQSASDTLAPCKRDACLETETEAEAETEAETEKRGKKAPASRLPTNWMPSEDDLEFCKTERPDLNAKFVADSFRDYWISQAGAKGRKTDWSATWRNWVRNQRAQPGAGIKTAQQQRDENNRKSTEQFLSEGQHTNVIEGVWKNA